MLFQVRWFEIFNVEGRISSDGYALRWFSKQGALCYSVICICLPRNHQEFAFAGFSCMCALKVHILRE